MQTTSCSMRPGGYRSFTFRLPAHLPTAHIAVAVSRGCVSLFASNCSRTPRAETRARCDTAPCARLVALQSTHAAARSLERHAMG